MKKYTFLLFAGFLFTSCVVEHKYLFHENGEDHWVSIEEYYNLKYERGLRLHESNPNRFPSPKDYAESWTKFTKKYSEPKKTYRLSILREKK